ncbi:6759_t:CDS:2 [Entrophospora sp. SA101]|nr:6759_t:CDS:2 [Entrophospora sp. SA101]CAJ0847159.1 5567_t:CDS:2 [Entrophospora sp. SA101]CAJ0856692.1 20257_t:CDS:2 [Entrophospora sp. SA101]
MSNRKRTCDACGHIIAKPVGYTANNLCLHVNGIKDFEQLIEFKKYFSHFVESQHNKILSFNFINSSPSSVKEIQFYKYLKDEYFDINESFSKFYDNYANSVDSPLNKNQISRALTALGLKTVIMRKKHNGKWCSIVMINASEDELSEIFQKNGI